MIIYISKRQSNLNISGKFQENKTLTKISEITVNVNVNDCKKLKIVQVKIITLFILIDYPVFEDAISMELSIFVF